jgi:formate dehydrogenase iron-sulfur subunit
MCAHRNFDQNNDAKPACVQVCPTSALEFGEREQIIAKAKELAKENDLNIYGLEENGGTSLIILNKADPYSLGYPKVEKTSSGTSPAAIGGTVVGLSALAAAAYAGLKKYSERRNDIENIENDR